MDRRKVYLKSREPQKVLAVSKALFFSGLGLMLLCLLLLQGTERAASLWAAVSVIGVAFCFGGIIYAAVRLRCPDCGKSLMAGGRLPMALPAYCPHCGKPMEKRTEN